MGCGGVTGNMRGYRKSTVNKVMVVTEIEVFKLLHSPLIIVSRVLVTLCYRYRAGDTLSNGDFPCKRKYSYKRVTSGFRVSPMFAVFKKRSSSSLSLCQTGIFWGGKFCSPSYVNYSSTKLIF